MQTFDILVACDAQRSAAIAQAIADFTQVNVTSEQDQASVKQSVDARVICRFSTSTLARWCIRVYAVLKGKLVVQEFDVWQQGRYPVAIIEDAA